MTRAEAGVVPGKLVELACAAHLASADEPAAFNDALLAHLA